MDFLVKFFAGVLLDTLLAETEELLEIVFALEIECFPIEAGDEIPRDRLLEAETIKPPVDAVRQDHPLDALVHAVVDGLPHMLFLKLDADALALDQESALELVVESNRKIAIRAANHQLARNLRILLVAEHLGQHVVDDGDGVGLVQIAVLGNGENLLELRHVVFETVFDFLCEFHLTFLSKIRSNNIIRREAFRPIPPVDCVGQGGADEQPRDGEEYRVEKNAERVRECSIHVVHELFLPKGRNKSCQHVVDREEKTDQRQRYNDRSDQGHQNLGPAQPPV